jgi:hypothetical protein
MNQGFTLENGRSQASKIRRTTDELTHLTQLTELPELSPDRGPGFCGQRSAQVSFTSRTRNRDDHLAFVLGPVR